MSENEFDITIKEYLKKVKDKLPDWLKDKKEHKEILAELEDHIWSKAEELSQSGQPTLETVRTAIVQMGTPESIAKEYKRRGTPKVYITEELWPYYKKVLTGVFSLIILITVVVQIVNLVFGNLDAIWDGILGIQIGILIAFAVITVIFVVLSMEGYFPEDFMSKKELEKRKKESDIVDEEKKPLKSFIKPIGVIIEGSLGLFFGVFLIVQPLPFIFSLIDGLFLLYLQFAGIFMIAEGVLDIIRGLIGYRQPSAHQAIHAITIGVKLASISVVVLMLNRPEIFPIIVFEQPSGALTNIGIA
ncbi:MAG: permease prefix domain 1-containing protein, partial [Promethearchaeota archaeon]